MSDYLETQIAEIEEELESLGRSIKKIYRVDSRPWLDNKTVEQALGVDWVSMEDNTCYVDTDGSCYVLLPVGVWNVADIEIILPKEEI